MRKIECDVVKLAKAVIDSGKRLVCLQGDLGAGKTTLMQEICRQLGVLDDVVSPTFSIVNVYSEGKIYHMDLYRIDEVSELDDIDFDGIVHEGDFVVVEWADRYAHLFPDDALWIKLGIDENGEHYAVLPEELEV